MMDALTSVFGQQGEIRRNQPLVRYSTWFAAGTLTSLTHSSSETSEE
jgi:hypothetical protein